MYIHTYRQTNKGENVSDTRKHSSRVRTCEYLWPPLDVSTWGRVYLLRPPPSMDRMTHARKYIPLWAVTDSDTLFHVSNNQFGYITQNRGRFVDMSGGIYVTKKYMCKTEQIQKQIYIFNAHLYLFPNGAS